MHLNWSPAFVRRSYELRFGQLTGLDQSFRNFEKSYVDFHILVFFQNQNRLSQQRICLTMVLIRFASFSIDFFFFLELCVSTSQNSENLMWISPILVFLQLDPTSDHQSYIDFFQK